MKNFKHLTPGDWMAISNLYSYYNLCSDSGDAEGYASCFTKDGVMDQVTRAMTIRGRQALVEYKKADTASRGGLYRRHWSSGLHLVEEAFDRVRGRCYLQAFNGRPGSLPDLQAVGIYDDTIVLCDDEWLFLHRKLAMDARIDTPNVTGGST